MSPRVLFTALQDHMPFKSQRSGELRNPSLPKRHKEIPQRRVLLLPMKFCRVASNRDQHSLALEHRDVDCENQFTHKMNGWWVATEFSTLDTEDTSQ